MGPESDSIALISDHYAQLFKGKEMTNMTCRVDDLHWDYYKDSLPYSQITVNEMKITVFVAEIKWNKLVMMILL